ncbi:MAG: formylglycine-generating enzyme family protein [Chthoniobacterales bacterium]|nr:formylglycine-generating enzyme family protein [Chthoniobacterales bacterium]
MKSPCPIQDHLHKILSSLFCAVLGVFLLFQSASLFATPAEMNAINPVQVADAGNQGDPIAYGWGSVSYEFWIGKNDVTVGEYAIFLNAVAQKDPLHLYDARMWSDRWQLIQRLGPDDQGNFHYQARAAASRYPIIFISYKNAQRYCNWLENGKPSGTEIAGITETGTYDLTSSTATIAVAEKTATFRLPTNNEYHKVTYYKGGSLNAGFYKYPTQTDTLPTSHSMDLNGTHNVNVGLRSQGTNGLNFLQNVGNTIHLASFPNTTYDGCNPHSAGFYGTHDNGSNVAQWTSTTDGSGSFLLVRGADWDYWDHNTNIWDPFYYTASTSLRVQTPDQADEHVGFRVVAITQEKANSIPTGPTAPIVDPTPEPTPEPTPTPEPSPTPAPKPTPSLIALPSPNIVDSIAPSDLQPNTKEFFAARAAYVEANNKYHEANDAYVAADVPYKEIQDKFVELYVKELFSLSDQYLSAYQQWGAENSNFIEVKEKFDLYWNQAGGLWLPHLDAIDKRLHHDRDLRDQAEQEYQLAQSDYKNICTKLGHINDSYDNQIVQYNQAIQNYIPVAYAFFEAESDWDQAIALYIYWRRQYVTNYEEVPANTKQRASADFCIKFTTDDYQNKNVVYQGKLKEFKKVYYPE